MSRPKRLEYPGSWHYVINKAIPERGAFLQSSYRRMYLQLLADMVVQCGIEIHAYCLMNNCSHLLIRCPNANLSKASASINSVFTQRVNRQEGQQGELFQGRYKSVLLDADNYLAQMSRYIHLFAAQADLPLHDTSRLSAQYYFDKTPPPWLSTQMVLSSLNNTDVGIAYKQYLAQGNTGEIETFYRKKRISPIMGSGEFRQKVLLLCQYFLHHPKKVDQTYLNVSVGDVIEIIALNFSISEEDLKTKPLPRCFNKENEELKGYRGVAVFLCRSAAGLSIKDIANEFSFGHHSAVSRVINQVQNKMKSDKGFEKEIKRLVLELRSVKPTVNRNK